MKRPGSFQLSSVIGIVVALLLIFVLFTGGAVAESDDSVNITVNTDSDTETDEEPDNVGIVVDNDTRILNYELVDGTAVITFESDRPQRITLVDVFSFRETGGQIIFKEVRLLPGESQVEIPVTSYRGDAFITIGTSNNLYAIELKSSSNLFSGTHNTLQILLNAAIGGVAGVIVTAKLIDYLKHRILRRRDL